MTVKFTAALFGGASFLALAFPAFAQDASTAVPAAAAPSSQLEAVVVTGSRIVRNGYAAPTPVTVAPLQEIQQTTPSNIPDALNKLPQFAGSVSQNSIATNQATNSSSTSGNFLNLRSFGVIRTLVLLDGQRVPATNFNGQVDTNTLPQMLVQRVDVVTGGASAVYGSDAVTGVVNFILDTRFNGLKAEAETGISGHGDAPSQKFGVAGGGPVLDRGHVIWSFEHYSIAGVNQDDRSFSDQSHSYTGAGTAASPYTLTANTRLATTSYGGLVTSGPFAGQQFAANGSLTPFTKGAATKSANLSVGGDAGYYYGLPLTNPLQTDQLFGRFDYALTDKVSAYVQVSGAQSQTHFHTGIVNDSGLTIYSGNPFLPAQAQSLLTASHTPSFTFNVLPQTLTLQSTLYQSTNAFNVTGGLTGKVMNDTYTWETYYTHGEGRIRSDTTNNVNNQKFYAALDAVPDPSSGNTVCRVTLTNPGLYPGCQPLNLFGGGANASQAALSYIYGDTIWQAVNKTDDVAASISGSPFNSWAGPVSVASNFEFRSQSLDMTSNASPLIAPTFTGIRLGATPTLPWQYSTVAPQHGANTVWEVSGETVVPLLSDVLLVKSLEFNGAVRYTDYSSSGGATTWKVGLNYQPVQDLRFRATESRDIRAPTLYDLYAGPTFSTFGLTDPHTGVSGSATVESLGNQNLVPEVSRTITAGFVYSPSWLPRFKFSVDYFDISIANAIGTIAGSSGNASAAISGCDASGGTSALCAAFVRPLGFSNTSPANFPTLMINQTVNIAQQYTHGLDVEAGYNVNLEDAVKLPGRLDVRLLYTYQPVLASRAFPGAQLVNAAGAVGLPMHRASAILGYDWENISIGWQTRYSGPENQGNGNPAQIYAGGPLPGVFYHDLNLSYRFSVDGHFIQSFLAVTNLLDQQPRIAPSVSIAALPGFGNPAVSGDDVIGRYFTVGLRFKY